MVRFYANENFPFPVVEELRRFGHDALTMAETGKANQQVTDEDVLAFAVSEQSVVLTRNRRRFIRLHRDRPEHAGIVVCTYDADFGGLAGHIHAACHRDGPRNAGVELPTARGGRPEF